MKIKTHEPPSDSVQEAVLGLGKIRRARSRGMLTGFSLEEHDLESDLMLPHPVYFIGLLDLLNPAWLTKARPVAWRYLISSASDSHAIVQVRVDHGTGKHKFHCVSYGQEGSETFRLYQLFTTAVRHSNRQFEMRMLIAPALGFSSLWFSSTTIFDDVFLPMESNVLDLRAGLEQSASQIEQKLIQLAVAKVRLLAKLTSPIFQTKEHKE